MAAENYLILLLLVLLSLILIVPTLLGNWLKYRGTRVVICPETRKPVAVEVDSTHAALTSVTGDADLRLSDCTRWPERHDCDQACLLQIELAPEDCLARNMLTNWYAGKKCVFCARPFENINWAAHKPALMGPDLKTIEWVGIRPETIPDVLKTHQPVCWNCHTAETFRRMHSDLVVDRDWHVRRSGKAAGSAKS
jgi:hypothetical protein